MGANEELPRCAECERGTTHQHKYRPTKKEDDDG